MVGADGDRSVLLVETDACGTLVGKDEEAGEPAVTVSVVCDGIFFLGNGEVCVWLVGAEVAESVGGAGGGGAGSDFSDAFVFQQDAEADGVGRGEESGEGGLVVGVGDSVGDRLVSLLDHFCRNGFASEEGNSMGWRGGKVDFMR